MSYANKVAKSGAMLHRYILSHRHVGVLATLCLRGEHLDEESHPEQHVLVRYLLLSLADVLKQGHSKTKDDFAW